MRKRRDNAGQLGLWAAPEQASLDMPASEAPEAAPPAPEPQPEPQPEPEGGYHAPPPSVTAPADTLYSLDSTPIPEALEGETLQQWCERTRTPPPGYMVRPWGAGGSVQPVKLCDPEQLTGAYYVLLDDKGVGIAKVCPSEAAGVYWLWCTVLGASLKHVADCLVNMHGPVQQRRRKRASKHTSK